MPRNKRLLTSACGSKRRFKQHGERSTCYSNIIAARTVAGALKSSLGPKSMDKMIVDGQGNIIVTNDGRTILEKMDIQHPIGKIMLEIAKAQDEEVGDGTTTIVVLAGELLKKAAKLMDRVHPTTIVEGYQEAAERALRIAAKIAVFVDPDDRETVKKTAMASLSGKISDEYVEHMADLAVSAALKISERSKPHLKVNLDDISVLRRYGGSLLDTNLIDGVVLDKKIAHPNMPKRVEKARIAVIEKPLRIENMNFAKFSTKLNIETPDQIDIFLKQEKALLQGIVDKIVDIGANVLVSHRGIDDSVIGLLAKKNILTVTHPKKEDLDRLLKATGAKLIADIENAKEEDLGHADLVEERKLPAKDIEKMVFFKDCRNSNSMTILIRGGTQAVIDEANRSMHDALCVARDVIQNPQIVGGGGAFEMEISKEIKEHSKTLEKRKQLVFQSFAEALEVIPETLSHNAGLNSLDTLLKLRAKHRRGQMWAGINGLSGKIENMTKMGVFDSLAVKEQAISGATEAASMILKIDDIIKSQERKREQMPKTPESSEMSDKQD